MYPVLVFEAYEDVPHDGDFVLGDIEFYIECTSESRCHCTDVPNKLKTFHKYSKHLTYIIMHQ